MLEHQIFQEALKLPPAARADLAEKILASLGQDEMLFQAEWAEEAERRIDAYNSGLTSSKSAEEVFAQFGL